MSESKFTRRWCKGQEAHGALTYPLVGSKYAPAGWPDRFYAHFRWQGFIEFKAIKGKLTVLQNRVHEQLVQRNQNIVVVRFSEDYNSIRIEQPVFSAEKEVIAYLPLLWHNWGGFLDAVTTV